MSAEDRSAEPWLPSPGHEVTNQSTPLEGFNAFGCDAALREAVEREGAQWAASWLEALGRDVADAQWIAHADAANRHRPQWQPFDRFGHRTDTIEFHPSYHALMQWAIGHGLHAAPWEHPRSGAHAARAAAYLLFGQLENGVQCPVTMTFASVAALRRSEPLWARLRDRVLSRSYDARPLALHAKRGITIGMGMTEKQGGSDVRSNTTRAEPDGGDGWRITGHKWFFSAPQSDAHLVLAQTATGPSCFVMPRVLPDGRRNAIRIQRLKDKLGNHSNASSEVEFDAAWAELLGEEGRGIATILEMGTMTRLDCALGSAGILRAALSQAIHHARARHAFGAALIDQPLMRSVLADLAIESEAATVLVMRVAALFDDASERGVELRRVLTPVAKFWVCKRLPAAVAECMEVLGGNGYVEDAPMARLFRESPLNSIWEGAGNVISLDVLRALGRTPRTVTVLLDELQAASGRNLHFDRSLAALRRELTSDDKPQQRARLVTQMIALCMQASLLLQHAPAEVADAFCATRLRDGQWGAAFGTLPAGLPVDAVLRRAWPNG